MWGDPSDLQRIQAQVQVTCKSCRASETWERDVGVGRPDPGGRQEWRQRRLEGNPMVDQVPEALPVSVESEACDRCNAARTACVVVALP